jgi:heptaprenylglyceryl phosphate synthase
MVTNHVNVSHPSFFDGSNLDYWKTCMRIHLKAMGEILWKVVDEGYVILNEANPNQADNKNHLTDAQDMNVIIRALCIHEYPRT